MTEPVYKPVVHLPELGEQGVLPPGGIINAGGTEGPDFTVGGKAVIFADGTASDGSGQVIVVGNGAQGVIGFEWVQITPSMTWIVPHMKGTARIQITIWDPTNEMVYADTVTIIDPDHVQITFNSALNGRAVLMLF